LTVGQINAVRAVFKAGITPSRIARWAISVECAEGAEIGRDKAVNNMTTKVHLAKLERKCFQTARSVLAVAFLLVFITCAVAKRMIPDDNLAYPVLITLKSRGTTLGSGSGIYLNAGDGFYLVTARHVIAAGLPDPKTNKIEVPDLVIELLSYSKDLPTPKRNVLSLDFKGLQDSGDVKAHQSRDIAVIRVGRTSKQGDGLLKTTFLAGVTSLEFSGTGVVAAGMDVVRTYDQVLVGNDAILYGYPASLGLPNTHQFDPLRPLLRKALIAGQEPQKHYLIIDGPVYRGNSGGPVFEIDVDFPVTHYFLVGVLTEFIPLTESTPDFMMLLNSGYSVAEPMDFVLELIGPGQK
jgi:hypothetical protein